jgi:triosephosphate isomerase
MRQPFIAGNWKMNLLQGEAAALARDVAAGVAGSGVDVAIFPTFVGLHAVREALGASPVRLGAQNCYAAKSGAFTGEIGPEMLVDAGCKHVILGHSERRTLLGETDAVINKKLHAALGAGLEPIVCVGELLEEREAGRTLEVVTRQCQGAFVDVTGEQMARVTLAYEPVWAIGTGRTATPAQAQEVHRDLRKWLSERYNPTIAGAVRIQYGGSVNAENAASLLGQPDIDGALVGGASLKAPAFLAIVAAARASS